MERVKLIKPGTFSVHVPADNRRAEFDCKNEIIVTNKVPVDFVFIGDSITHLWELNAYFGMKNRLVLNRGIGGDTSEYVFKRFEADVLQLKPRYCVMKIGINDSWALDQVDRFVPKEIVQGRENEAVDIIVDRVVNNITSIIDLAVKNNQKLILCSMLPTNISTVQTNKERNLYILSVNSRLKQLCSDKGLIFVDYHSSFVDTDGITLKDGLTTEGLHPHVFGYNVMADVLRTALKQNSIEI